MAFEAIISRKGIHRVVLESYPEGVYVFVFEGEHSRFPERDYLQDDVEMAMRMCESDFGIARREWDEVPDPGLR